jgi:hypothetical protein
MSDDGSAWNSIMQYAFLHVFANDDTIDAGELAMMERLALADGQIDDREREVLGRIFARANQQHMTVEVRESIDRFKARHGIP